MKHKTTINAVETQNLGKEYGLFWALKDCNVTVPQGSVSALVGPNGAGKTTLLKLLTGLSKASVGNVVINGKAPEQSKDFLAEIGYLAQEIPLYKSLTAADHITMGKHLNVRWDEALIRTRLNDLGIPLDRPVSKLSGGQQAQVALALALAKKPQLLLLDEPVAALDPLARHDFLSSLAQAVAEGGLTVVMSSHLLADLEQVCDRIIIVAAGKTQVCDDIEYVLKTHKLLVGPRQRETNLPTDYTVIIETHAQRQSTLLVRNDARAFKDLGRGWEIHDVSIEDIVLAYMGQAKQLTTQPTTNKGDVR